MNEEIIAVVDAVTMDNGCGYNMGEGRKSGG